MEEWKKIKTDKIETNFYEVSSLGRVRNIKTGRFLQGQITKNGYKLIHLRMDVNKTCSLHRLVLCTFQPIDNMENLQVNHKDGNKQNNNLENLEWVTAKENIRHSFKTGLQKYESKEIFQYDLKGNFIKKWVNASEIQEQLGFSLSTILRSAKCGKSKAFNYMWRYFYKEKISPYENINNKIVYMYNKEKTELLIIFSSQKEAARHIGCATSTLSRYLTGMRKQPKNSPFFLTNEPLDI